jgi:hypothetical protein
VDEATRTLIRRAFFGVLLVTAAGLLWWSASFKAKPTSPSLTDAAVEALTPENDTPNVLRQSTIGIDLKSGWDADLIVTVNGTSVDIPQDEERNIEAQNQVFFTPGDGKAIEQLGPGLVQVTAIIWRPIDGQTREQGSRAVRWSFHVS